MQSNNFPDLSKLIERLRQHADPHFKDNKNGDDKKGGNNTLYFSNIPLKIQ